ncbi:MAG: ATP-dependent zinc metalloprotease FtsH [Phycisphaeraceae bacterium]|nr:ATP-dependent zinc metalloprotease FtsH [Phycisphaeraceae bacterium]
MSDQDDNNTSQDQRRNGKDVPPQRPNPNFPGRSAFVYIILIALAIGLLLLMQQSSHQVAYVSWQQFYSMAQEHAFDGSLTAEDESIWATVKDNPSVSLAEGVTPGGRVATRISPYTKQLRLYQLDKIDNLDLKEEHGTGWLAPLLWNFGPLLLLVLLIYFFVYRSLRSAGAGPGMLGNFGRSKHRLMNKEHSNVTLNDVAGIDEAKEEVGEIIEFLKNPKRFQRLGGRVPRGVLLIGAPGCGKTLLAKAVAGEADVPFFSISGSDFVEMFVGVGASRVRDLFKQAKDSSPCIIFLDEIDAVGRKRGSGFTSGGHDEREQTLNAILVEMDGFDSSDQVIVMAATNRSDVLDPALTRPGRFDRQITVPLPDVAGRVEILKVHSRKIKMSPRVDLEKLARGTPMFSGAELAAIINEAAIAATLLNKDFVEQDDLEEARDKVKWGRARKSHKVEEEEKVATAWHEAGHAVVQHLLPHTDPLHKVTIIPRGQSMGATIGLPEKDRHNYTRKYIHDTLRVLCAGRIAEQRKTDDVSSGAAMDIRMATNMARYMILEWGMSEKLGFVDYTPQGDRDALIPEKAFSPETARIIDQEIKRLIDEAYGDTEKIIGENWEKIGAIGEALLKYETLSREEVDRIMRGEPLTKATVSDLLAAEKKKQEKPKAKTGDRPQPAGPPESGALPSPA